LLFLFVAFAGVVHQSEAAPCRGSDVLECGENAHCERPLVGPDKCECDEGFVGNASDACVDQKKCKNLASNGYGCGDNTDCTYSDRNGYYCVCAPDYYGPPLQGCVNETICRGIASCGNNTDCNYGAALEWRCSCQGDLVGDPQDECITTDECSAMLDCGPNTGCRYRGRYTCYCLRGFVGPADSRTGCISEEECSTRAQCGANTDCSYKRGVIKGEYVCSCSRGFIGDPYEGCISQETCIAQNNCTANSHCNQTEVGGEYYCSCDTAFVGDPYDPEKGCYQCPEGAKSQFDPDLGFSCACEQGFVGDPYEQGCIYGQDCDVMGICGEHGYCSYYEDEKYFCFCKAGFVGDAYDGCVDREGCLNITNCGANSICKYNSTAAEYYCYCMLGYEGDPYSDQGCVDVDECSSNSPPSCADNAFCSNYDGGAECLCEEGYDGWPEDVGCYPCSETQGNWICQNGGLCMSDSSGYTTCDCSETSFNGDYCDQGEVTRFGDYSGVLTSINYPNNYPHDVNSTWRIIAPEGYYTSLLFTDFHTARDYDQVRVYYGENSQDFFDYFVGDSLPDPMQFADSNVTVIYLSDGYFTRRGFSLEWKVHETPECISERWFCQQGGLCTANEDASYACDCSMTSFTGEYCDRGTLPIQGQATGILTSINYPNYYPFGVNSSWALQADDGFGFNIMFLDFLTEDYGDDVTVYNSTSLVATFKGLSIPPPLQINDSDVTINFVTDTYYRNTGWKLQWATFEINPPVLCEVLLVPSNGDISCNNTTTEVSTVCSFECYDGYALVGSQQVVCGEDGVWSDEEPICQAITCPAFDPLENGEVICSDGNNFNSICTFQCAPGYDLTGNSSAICRGDGISPQGEWDQNAPVCSAAVEEDTTFTTSDILAVTFLATTAVLLLTLLVVCCCYKRNSKSNNDVLTDDVNLDDVAGTSLTSPDDNQPGTSNEAYTTSPTEGER